MAKEVYGNDWPIDKQIQKLFPPKLAKDVFDRFGVTNSTPSRSEHGGLYKRGRLYMNNNSTTRVRTSDIAVSITTYLGSKINQTKVRGIVYSGNHDGECAFVRNFSDVVPFYYSKDIII